MAAALVFALAFIGAGAVFTGCEELAEPTNAGSGPGPKDVTFASAVIEGEIAGSSEAEVTLTFKGADGLAADNIGVTISPDSVGIQGDLSKEADSDTRYKLTIKLNEGAGSTLQAILKDVGVFITVTMDTTVYNISGSPKRVTFGEQPPPVTKDVTFESAVIEGEVADSGEAEVTLTFKGADSGLAANNFGVTISPNSVGIQGGLSKEADTRYKLTIGLTGSGGAAALQAILEGAGVFITVTMVADGYTLYNSTKRVEFENAPPSVPLSKFSGTEGEGDSVIDVIKSAATTGIVGTRGAQYNVAKDSLILTLPEAEEEPLEQVQLGEKNLPSGGLVLTNNGSGTFDAATNNSPANVTIDGGGRVIDQTTPSGTRGEAPLITVGSGVTLTLKNITFKGLKTDDGDGDYSGYPLILVDGGKLILEAGAVIRDNHGYSGGVTILGDGDLIMENGSEIRNNQAFEAGGGISIKCNDASHGLTMNGGTISNNKSELGGGGGVLLVSGKFDMIDGTISNNTVSRPDADITPYGGGGVFVCEEYYSYNGVYPFNVPNGNPEVSAMFYMSGGTISYNTVTNDDRGGGGGGVNVWVGVFDMSGSSTISGNKINNQPYSYGNGKYTADLTGGGVFVYGDSTFKKSGDSTISGNTSQTDGHEVYWTGDSLILEHIPIPIPLAPKKRDRTVDSVDDVEIIAGSDSNTPDGFWDVGD
jgi:hypothetical protein